MTKWTLFRLGHCSSSYRIITGTLRRSQECWRTCSMHPSDLLKISEPEEIQGYDLIGFGSGIYDGMHHKELLHLAERLPELTARERSCSPRALSSTMIRSRRTIQPSEAGFNRRVTRLSMSSLARVTTRIASSSTSVG